MPVLTPGPMNAVVSQLKGVKRQSAKRATKEPHGVIVVNNTGAGVVYGDVVCVDPGAERSVEFASEEGAANPLVVYAGGEDGENIKCLDVSVVITVVCDGDALTPGDLVIASATAGYGTKSPADAFQGIIGIALETKGGGVGSVPVLLIPQGKTAAVVDSVEPTTTWPGMLWVDTS